MLHVLAYTTDHSQQVLDVFENLDSSLRSDTILVVTTTEGEDDFLY